MRSFIFVDEHGSGIGILHDDTDFFGIVVERGDFITGYLATIDTARQNSRAPTQPGSGDGRIECGTSQYDRTVRLNITADMTDDQIFRGA